MRVAGRKDFHKIVSTYLLEGLEQVKEDRKAEVFTDLSLRRAIKQLCAEYEAEDVADILEWAKQDLGMFVGRGAGQAAKPGDEKIYSAQQWGDSAGTFIRLPVDSLGVAKQGKVKVKVRGNKKTGVTGFDVSAA